jgi:hypothetical protein
MDGRRAAELRFPTTKQRRLDEIGRCSAAQSHRRMTRTGGRLCSQIRPPSERELCHITDEFLRLECSRSRTDAALRS